MKKHPKLISAQWPALANVHAFTTTRSLPCAKSEGIYASLNLALHTNDHAKQVIANRDCLAKTANLPSSPFWLNQTHGNVVHRIGSVSPELKQDELKKHPLKKNAPEKEGSEKIVDADASVTSMKNIVCAVLTADCLPVFFCHRSGTEVAVAHAGWRGLHAGILQNTVAEMQSKVDDLLVWFGPAIGPTAFEVGEEVRQAFVEQDANHEKAFKRVDSNHFLCDLTLLARLALSSVGVNAFYGDNYCTFSDSQRFYSFRRDGETGRMASLIWFN